MNTPILHKLALAAEIKRTKIHLSNLQNQKETTMQKVFNPNMIAAEKARETNAEQAAKITALEAENAKLKTQVSALAKARSAQPPAPAKATTAPARELTGIERVSAAFAKQAGK